jgi:hypothetical protein
VSIYGFWQGPTYRPSTRDELFGAALDMPMSAGATFWDQAKGGALESFGLGSAIRDARTPDGAPLAAGRYERPEQFQARRDAFAAENKVLDEEAYKTSPYFRDGVPWDASMTEDKAAALATMYDAKQVRQYFAEKRPITAFFGNLAGQATDPINYIPVAGPTVKAAAVARMGVVKGIAATAALDAAANTALAGLATRETRRSYGDDVSWQAMVSEIATAALLGTAFGTVGGVLERRAGLRADALRSEAEVKVNTLRATQEASIALNEAIGGLANDGEVRLSPNGIAPIERIVAQSARTQIIEPVRTVGAVDRSWAGQAVEGQSVVTPTGLRVAVKPEVVDAMDLVKASGELQPRDRSRAASDAQIAEMAANLDPARLMFSPEADRGAPIVGPDGVVESGNGRVAALIRAAQTNPERFAAYKQALKDAGFNVPDKGIPVLVSRRVGDLTDAQRAQFVNDANTSAIARMSATETAMMDTRAMTSGTLANYVPGDINSAANRAFVGSFLRNLPSNERLSLVDADGRLNVDGIRRIDNALIAAAYGDADVVARFAETPDDNVKSIMGAMSDAAGEWSAMRKDIADGLIDADFDVTPSLTDALRFMSRAREKAVAEKRPVATVIKEEMGQLDLLAGEIDPRTKAFVQSFYKNDQFTQANGRDIIADHLRNITRAARDLGKPSLFGDAIAVRPQEMIENARPQARQGDLLGSVSAREGGGTDRAGQEVISLFGTGETLAQGARRVDTSPARPEPPPAGRAEAEAKVAKPENYKALADQYRVDPEAGTFPEEAELRQLAQAGRLSDEDMAVLDDADAAFQDGAAYGEALRSVVSCLL